MTTRILLASLVSMVAASANAQDFTRMDFTAMNNAFNARMNAQINQSNQGIVNRNLANPQVQAMYRQHVANGGRMSPEQFAYNYAATAGFTPQGMAYFRATEARNQAAEMNALNGYRAAQAARGQAQMDWSAGFQRNNAEFGNLLMGNSTYGNPITGGNTVLPHTLPAGQFTRDGFGNVYQRDARGNYYMYNNGWWYPMSNGR